MAEKLGQEERLRKATVQAFITSQDFDETRMRFDRLKTLSTLTEADIQQIIEGFSKNDQLYNAIYLRNHNNRLVNFLENRTEKKFIIEGKAIKEIKAELVVDEEIPF